MVNYRRKDNDRQRRCRARGFMLTIYCPKHKHYTGKQAPRASCEPCKVLWEIRNLDAGVKGISVKARYSSLSAESRQQ